MSIGICVYVHTCTYFKASSKSVFTINNKIHAGELFKGDALGVTTEKDFPQAIK